MKEKTRIVVKVPLLVYEGITEIRMSNLVDMNDPILVEQTLLGLGFDVAAKWIVNNPELYHRGLYEGFEIENNV